MVNPDDVREVLRKAEEKVSDSKFQVPNLENENPRSKIQNPQSNCGVGSFLNIMPNGDVFPCHVLTDREFRCGNLREQSLVEICSRNGLLGKLSALNFQDLAKSDSQFSELKNQTVCLGNVNAQTKSSLIQIIYPSK